jgi:hypothetical protein
VINWRLGHFTQALTDLDACARKIEACDPKASPALYALLADLYQVLVRGHLFTGQIDKAMEMVLRANYVLGIERLDALPELDIRAAQLVRAGLAAGKMVLGGGSATMVVKGLGERQGATANPAPKPEGPQSGAPGKTTDSKIGKIIPFPSKGL